MASRAHDPNLFKGEVNSFSNFLLFLFLIGEPFFFLLAMVLSFCFFVGVYNFLDQWMPDNIFTPEVNELDVMDTG